MPNIIEQQDLLKGLPDARLAMLMQNPAGDIPPFLVAAEAQRRQAIRQQFSGAGSNESVVDTLTKQMANVPQNIQAPMQTPPQIPPPMMASQAGIAAIPQQAPQMAGGGMVRRYQAGGQIEPMWRFPSFSSALPDLGSWAVEKSRGLYDWATTPYSEQGIETSPTVSEISSQLSLPDKPLPGRRPEFEITGQPSEYTDLTPKPKLPRNPTAGGDDTSLENKYKSEEAALREQLKSLYSSDEPSNWEEAQKWFAMSAQIMNPEATLMQGIVNAGNVYAQAEGEQARAKREDERALREALLKWDLSSLESRRASEAAAAEKAAEREAKLIDKRIPSADSAIRAIGVNISDIDKQLENVALPSTDKDRLLSLRSMYVQQLAEIMNKGGFGVASPTREELEAYSTGQ